MLFRSISLIFRNVGSAQVSIAAVYLEGVTLSPAASTVAIAGTVSYSLTVAGLTITPGASYTLKVVTATGGTFSFSVVA